jgi:Aspartyl protease
MVSGKNLFIILLLISVNALAQDSGKKIPFKLFNNHIYIRGILNDELQVWILLDCGAGTMVSDEQAKKGKIKTRPYGQTDGIGNNIVPYQMTDSASFDLGSVRYTEKMIPVLSFKEIEDCGAMITVDKKGKIEFLKERKTDVQPIDAVLGDKFFRRFVVEIDYQKQILTLYEPSTFQYAGKGDRIPLQYSDNHIYARASITGPDSLLVSGYFLVDCGSMTGVILNVPFIKQYSLTPSPEATELSLCGIGGSSKSMMGTLEDLQIGKSRIKKPITIFSQASGGVLTKQDIAGNIGNAILRRFHVIFDYSRKEMILE